MVLWSLILAAFLLIGTWVGGYFLSWPLWLKILITVVVVLAVVTIILLRRIRAIIQARRLERDIMKQAEEQAANARPDRRGEILELQRQIQRGIASLRGSKLGLAVNNLADSHNIVGVTPANAATANVAYAPAGADLLNLLPGRSVMVTFTAGYAPRR